MTAFEAVLADIASRGIRSVYNLGDVAGKGPRGSEAVRLSRERCTVTVRGNWDDMLGTRDLTDLPEMQWWATELSADDRHWLGSLPESHDLALGDHRIRMFHASATSVYSRGTRIPNSTPCS
ncbi:hypothetical protein [Planctomonas sp. JC2975]|uniref:metallophosphoesterase family protein n=1 Tax=Planctomonas sp. JC2975 TaxID=2729626 RepID=UPI003211D397